MVCGERQLTYRELRAQAGRLAARLRTMGVGPEQRVGILLERSVELVVALLGVLKAGGAYLPLDPAYPAERVASILEDAAPRVVLTERSLAERVPAGDAQVLCVEDKWTPAPGEAAPFVAGSGPENLAYVIYTSGSTGRPKGVMVTQGSVDRLLTATAPWFRFSENDVWTFFHSAAFDFSVWEIWGCLLHGGRLVVVPFAVSRSPLDFHDLLVREKVTVLNQTPSAFYQLIAADLDRRSPGLALRLVIFGGEALNFSALRPWIAARGDRMPQLVNMYGITETTVHVTYRRVTAADAEGGAHSLIGVPIPDLQIHLLGEDRQPVAAGEVGEIYVGGAGVARGYLNRPELNAERFLPDLFSKVPGARLYKSGDLARYLPGGELEYLGRGDAQVKIQGFRIELGEIEAALSGFPRVREVRVGARTDEAGTKRLVAWYVARDGAAIPAGEMSEYLKAKLPAWMMPSFYMQVTEFPLTANGKVDLAALPEPAAGSATGSANEAETGEADAGARGFEQKIAGVWREVLRAEHIRLDDNFFDIGGNSLLLVAVHSRLQKLLERRIPVTDLFACTTVRALSERLSRPEAEAGAFNAAQSQAEKQRAAFARARAARLRV